MAVWDDVIPREEQEIYLRGGMGRRPIGGGQKPALLIIDMTYGFVDSSYPLGHGETGWPCVRAIARLLERARAVGVPVLYTAGKSCAIPSEAGRWKGGGAVRMQDPKANEVVAELAPRADEPVIRKTMPSGFHETNLLSQLIYHNVDTVIATGMVTSGCVRATVVDAFSYNFRVLVPEEAVADRGQTSHKVALFDMQMKYADVGQLEEAIAYLERVVAATAGV